MKDLELTPRLRAIGSQVPQGAKLADVGTDHAYLPVWLLLNGRIQSAIASDVKEGPLLRGRETARTYGVEENMTFRLCDGLNGIEPKEVDTVVIAGMGGELIARILEAAPWTRNAALLLQPMSSQPELRQWLTENGYRIHRETVAAEGRKLYTILSVTGGESTPYTQAELWAGRQRKGENAPHRLAYLDDLISRRERAIAGMRKGVSHGEEVEREEALLTALLKLREEWKSWQQ